MFKVVSILCLCDPILLLYRQVLMLCLLHDPFTIGKAELSNWVIDVLLFFVFYYVMTLVWVFFDVSASLLNSVLRSQTAFAI